jgi:hypothetical protein
MISVRKQFKKIIEVNKEWNSFIVRHLTDTDCVCTHQPPTVMNVEKGYTEPNKLFRTIPDPACNICGGAGYLFEEYLFKGLFFYPSFRIAHFEDMVYSSTEQNVLTVYVLPTQETDILRVNDWIFNIDCEIDGSLKHPITRRKKWIMNDKQPIRLDNNKLEYIKLFAKPAIL